MPRADALVKSVEALEAEREALAAKEKDLIAAPNRALTQIGYEVVPGDARVRHEGRSRL